LDACPTRNSNRQEDKGDFYASFSTDKVKFPIAFAQKKLSFVQIPKSFVQKPK